MASYARMSAFAALLLSLPAGNSTLRMRLWRTLRATGCAVLRDGVYILPADAPQTSELANVEAAVQKAGGTAMTVELVLKDLQLPHVRALFDRTSEYAELVSNANAVKSAVRRMGPQRAETAY